MSRHDPRLTLSQMLAHAREAHDLCRAKTRADLDRERLLELGLLRLLEVLGEGATRLPDELRQRHPEVPWARITGLRNRLIHAYDYINLDIIWAIVTTDPTGPFSKFTTLPTQIFQWTSRPQQTFLLIAGAAIIVLLILLFILNAFAIYLRNRYARRIG